MAGYIGKSQGVTQVDGYNRSEADAEFVQVSGDTMSADGSTVLTVNRATSDGTIIDLQKNGSSVGSIGTDGGYLTFDNSAVKIGKSETGQLLLLTATETATPRLAPVADNAVNVGNTTTRFKDLYLSGGVYLGGTGSANYLDDYETGTFTPTFANVGTGTYSDQTGSYVKIGDVVHVSVTISLTSLGTASGHIIVSGFPFTSVNISGVYAGSSSIHGNGWNTARSSLNLLLNANQTQTNILYYGMGSTSTQVVTHADIGTGSLIFSMTYRTA